MTEEEYLSSLNEQRHMYEWCMKNVGGLSIIEVKLEADKLYYYEPPEEEHRWLVFHEDAWHWAMLKLNGEQYWVSNPELKSETKEYVQEYKRYTNINLGST